MAHRGSHGRREPSPPQIDAYILAATEVLRRHEPHVTVLDARLVTGASAYTRQRSREWLDAHRAELESHCLGTVYVVGATWIRFVVMMSLLLSRLPTPYLVCETLDEGFAWARERLGTGRAPSL